MRIIQAVTGSGVAIAFVLNVGCASTQLGTQELIEVARRTVERQECEAITLVRALASAQTDAANASWDSILNAAAQNFRTRKGLQLDALLSDEDHAAVLGVAHENLETILDHVSKTEGELLEAIRVDYEHRSRLLEELVGAVRDEDARHDILDALERLDDARRRSDVDQIDHSFKKAIERQIGYVG